MGSPKSARGFCGSFGFIVGTGRCCRRMRSNIFRQHADIQRLGVPHFIGQRTLLGRDREAVFRRLHTLSPEGRVFSRERVPSGRVPLQIHARIAVPAAQHPTIMGSTIPHITDDPERTWNELAAALRQKVPETLADQYRFVSVLALGPLRQICLDRAFRAFPAVHADTDLDISRRAVSCTSTGNARDTALSMPQSLSAEWVPFNVLRPGIDPNRANKVRPDGY